MAGCMLPMASPALARTLEILMLRMMTLASFKTRRPTPTSANDLTLLVAQKDVLSERYEPDPALPMTDSKMEIEIRNDRSWNEFQHTVASDFDNCVSCDCSRNENNSGGIASHSRGESVESGHGRRSTTRATCCTVQLVRGL